MSEDVLLFYHRSLHQGHKIFRAQFFHCMQKFQISVFQNLDLNCCSLNSIFDERQKKYKSSLNYNSRKIKQKQKLTQCSFMLMTNNFIS